MIRYFKTRRNPANFDGQKYLWYVEWREGGRGSKKHKVPLMGVGGVRLLTEKQAETAFRTWLRDHAEDAPSREAEKMSLRTFAEKIWKPIRAMTNNLSRTWVDQTDYMLNRHVYPALGDKPLAQITAQDVRESLKAIWDPEKRTGRRASARQVSVILKAIMNCAVKEGYLSRNPVTITVPDKPRDPNAQAQSLEAICTVINNTPSHWRPFVTTAAFTGMRWGELAALTWGDVDFEHGIIHVTKQIPTHYKDVTAPKWGSARTIDMLPPARDGLMDLALRDPERAKDKGATVFVTPEGKPLHERNFYRRVWNAIFAREAVKRAGVKRFKFENDGGLRHFFGSLMILLTGGDIYKVARWTGHRQISTLTQVYGREIATTERGGALDEATVWTTVLTAYRASDPAPELPARTEQVKVSK